MPQLNYQYHQAGGNQSLLTTTTNQVSLTDVYMSWTEDRIRELHSYSDEEIKKKLIEYGDVELQRIITYADRLSLFNKIRYRPRRICRLAQDVFIKRREEEARQKKLYASFQHTVLPLLTSEYHEKAICNFGNYSKLYERIDYIQKICKPFLDYDVALMFATDPVALERIVDSFYSHPSIYASLFISIEKIQRIEKENNKIEDIVSSLPDGLCNQLALILPVAVKIPPSDLTDKSDDAILKYYVKKASKTFNGWDMVVFVVKKILKKLLGVPILPILSVTSVYLFITWSEMIRVLDHKHYGTMALSVDKIVAISLSLVTILLQLLNRETSLSYIKKVYEASVTVKDFVAKMPMDIKCHLSHSFLACKNETISKKIEEILSYNIITWNNILEELTEIKDLSMVKSLNMLYTFRVGTTYIDYVNLGKGMQLHSLSEYWDNYGPLPNKPEQLERMFSLFRDQQEKFKIRFVEILEKNKPNVAYAHSYPEFIQNCKKVYDELSIIVLAYHPSSYSVCTLYTLTPVCSSELITEVSKWAHSVCVKQTEKSLMNVIQFNHL